MKSIRNLQSIYGKGYGALVFASCLFFLLAGVIWFGKMLIVNKEFNTTAFAMMLVFATLLVYHKKLAALVAGIISLFFSLFLFMGIAANKASLLGVFAIGIIVSLLAVISSGILIFSFLKAFKHSENL